jgi:hypothetical protein
MMPEAIARTVVAAASASVMHLKNTAKESEKDERERRRRADAGAR